MLSIETFSRGMLVLLSIYTVQGVQFLSISMFLVPNAILDTLKLIPQAKDIKFFLFHELDNQLYLLILLCGKS